MFGLIDYLQFRGDDLPGWEPYNLFGWSDDIDSGAFQSLGMGSDLTYHLPAEAIALAVASTSVNDTGAGTGARTVRIHGLGADYLEITEDITLNGTTKSAGSKLFLRINDFEVLTAGSGGSNAGNIWVGPAAATFTAGVPDTKMWFLRAEWNQSASGQFCVPAGQALYLQSFHITAQSTTASKIVDCRLETRVQGGLWVVRYQNSLSDGEVNLTELVGSLTIAEKTDIRFRAKASAADSQVSALGEFWRLTG